MRLKIIIRVPLELAFNSLQNMIKKNIVLKNFMEICHDANSNDLEKQ